MKWLSSGIASASLLAVLYVYERKRPLRKQIEPKEISTARNLAIASAAGLAMQFAEKPVAEKLTNLVEKNNIGLLKIFRLPKRLETVIAVLLLDYTLYIWHVLTHKSQFLWRFHRIHHADLDLTASTGIRFHFGEITISVLFRAGQILLIGVSPDSLKIWQKLLFISVFFHHSNVNLPETLEKKLQKYYYNAATSRNSSFKSAERERFKLVKRFNCLGFFARYFSGRCSAIGN